MLIMQLFRSKQFIFGKSGNFLIALLVLVLNKFFASYKHTTSPLLPRFFKIRLEIGLEIRKKKVRPAT